MGQRVRPMIACSMILVVLSASCTENDSASRQARPSDAPASRSGSGRKGARPHFTPPPLTAHGPHLDDWFESACSLPEEQFKRIKRGHLEGLSPELYVVPRPPNFFGGFETTTHSGPWPYLQRVPLVFYGPGVFASLGSISRPGTTLADVAPTLALMTGTELAPQSVGRSVRDALAGATSEPKLIVVVVWDGGGWDVLRTWPNSWPNLGRMLETGTSITDATVGSSPSVTPAVHATIGTGAFPKQHGIVDMHVRDGDDVVSTFKDGSPEFLRVPTYADIYDRSRGNRPKVGMFAYHDFHAGMMGQGAHLRGGDKDIQVIAPSSASVRFTAEENYYKLPSYLDDIGGFSGFRRAVDARDGKVDGRWRGRDLNDPNDVRHSPVWVQFQTKLIKQMIRRERFGDDAVTDLLFVNYKQIDDAGHDWNMLSHEMKDVLEQTDEDLNELISFLDRQVGRGEWGLVMTADHGQAPDAQAARAWPIGIATMIERLAEHFGVDEDDVIDETRPTGLWLDQEGLAGEDITEEEIADFILQYRIGDDIEEGDPIPGQYETRLEEPVFDAVFPSSAMRRIATCIQDRGGD